MNVKLANNTREIVGEPDEPEKQLKRGKDHQGNTVIEAARTS